METLLALLLGLGIYKAGIQALESLGRLYQAVVWKLDTGLRQGGIYLGRGFRWGFRYMWNRMTAKHRRQLELNEPPEPTYADRIQESAASAQQVYAAEVAMIDSIEGIDEDEREELKLVARQKLLQRLQGVIE